MGWKRSAGETDSHWGASQKFRQQVMGDPDYPNGDGEKWAGPKAI